MKMKKYKNNKISTNSMNRGVLMKYYSLFLALVLIIILSGASGCQTTTTTPKTGTFIGGTDGVSVSFVNLAPPSSFTQTDSARLKVLLTNKGETPIQTGNAKVRIFGITVANFGLTDAYKSTLGPLEAEGEFTATGGEQEIDFGQIHYTPDIINQETFTIRARLCYPYQTIAKTDVCIQSLITQESQGEICTLTDEKVVEGSVSAAPIQITSILEQTRGNDQVRFDIKIENKGTGELFSIEDKCEDLDDDFIRFDSKNKIKVKIRSPIDVKCGFRTGEPSSEGVVTLDETGVATLSCWKNVDEPVVDKLDIQLDYLYRDQVTKDITIFQSTK